MRNLPAIFSAALLFSACGSKTLTAKNKVETDPKDSPPQNQRGCPAGTFTNFHTVALSFARGYPEKVGIKLEGDKELRVNECKQGAQNGVIASVVHDVHTTLLLKVDHNNFFTTKNVAALPKTQAFEVYDMHLCNGAEGTLFHKQEALPIDWKVSYPNGTGCASQAVGEASKAIANVEESLREQLGDQLEARKTFSFTE